MLLLLLLGGEVAVGLPAAGHRELQADWRRAGQRQESAPPEGGRPSPGGPQAAPSLAGRRQSPRPKTAGLVVQAQQERAAAGLVRGPLGQSSRGKPPRGGQRWPGVVV
jgi:hypothetical protein